jgi:hypothetical protein
MARTPVMGVMEGSLESSAPQWSQVSASSEDI